jgi:hypothetical protein
MIRTALTLRVAEPPGRFGYGSVVVQAIDYILKLIEYIHEIDKDLRHGFGRVGFNNNNANNKNNKASPPASAGRQTKSHGMI